MQVFLFLLITAPRINVSPESYDFGEITWKKVSYTFTVTNEGDDTLKIQKVGTSCGCTQAKIDKKILPPGAKAKLTVTFSPGSHKIRGEVIRKISIRSNDPKNPAKIITISAKVFPPETYSSRKKYKELPDFAFSSQNTLKAYISVKENPEFYESFPCYCGCDNIHNSLKECYILEGRIIEHASDCDICIDEVLDIANLRKQNIEKNKILSFIKEKYETSKSR